MTKTLSILGTRGVPARHGGFETFAEKLSLYLVEKGWRVTVYCQDEGEGKITESTWQGVRRIHIPVRGRGAAGTVIFDLRATYRALREEGLFLTLGYNTAVFNLAQRLNRQRNVINMDGIEWRRAKWGKTAKLWFWINERVGCWVGNHLVADHPRIKDHLSTRVSQSKITMIPYGGDEVLTANAERLSAFKVAPDGFSIIIARPEPENSVLEMVRAFSSKKRGHKLIVLGTFDVANSSFHRSVVQSASDEVLFPGAIYESEIVRALRFYCRFYLHGHQVGGTNPSLVEALGAGCAVIAHDNEFNRWVAGEEAAFFKNEHECILLLDTLLHDQEANRRMKTSSRARYNELFTWQQVLSKYERMLSYWHP